MAERRSLLRAHADDAELGQVPHIRTPIRMGNGIAVRFTAPKLGQHNAEVYGALGQDEAALQALRDKGVI